MHNERYFALIPAAGVGARMGGNYPKQYLPVGGMPMLMHVLRAFAVSPLMTKVFVVVSAEDAWIDDMMAASALPRDRVVVLKEGGATRRETVANGLDAMAGQVDGNDWIMVHDAARPGLTPAMIERLTRAVAADAVGGLLALPIVDTVKQSCDAHVTATIPRETLWAAQTPQMFRHKLLRQALARADGVTDESSAVERLGLQPLLVPGSLRNMKVTHPGDIATVELLMKGKE